jgi:hypothetical protein
MEPLEESSTTRAPVVQTERLVALFYLGRSLDAPPDFLLGEIRNLIPNSPWTIQTVAAYQREVQMSARVPAWFHVGLRELQGIASDEEAALTMTTLSNDPLYSNLGFVTKIVKNWRRYCIDAIAIGYTGYPDTPCSAITGNNGETFWALSLSQTDNYILGLSLEEYDLHAQS